MIHLAGYVQSLMLAENCTLDFRILARYSLFARTRPDIHFLLEPQIKFVLTSIEGSPAHHKLEYNDRFSL